MSSSQTFTAAGFPDPDDIAEYNHEQVVWVYINPQLPYWPGQIKIGGTS